MGKELINEMRCWACELVIKMNNCAVPIEEKKSQLEALKLYIEATLANYEKKEGTNENLPRGWKLHYFKRKYVNVNSDKVWFSSLCGLVSSGERTKRSEVKDVNCKRCLQREK